VLGRFFAAVATGGALAVQLPTHRVSLLHRDLVEVAELAEWRETTRHVQHAIVQNDAGFYYDILSALAERVDLWETEYWHVMSGPAAILDWIRGTGLRPFLAALTTDAERRRFEAALLERLTASYPRRSDGRVLFPFRRVFFVAYRSSAHDARP
jgi:trans-aconitate 2-methyltransferase